MIVMQMICIIIIVIIIIRGIGIICVCRLICTVIIVIICWIIVVIIITIVIRGADRIIIGRPAQAGQVLEAQAPRVGHCVQPAAVHDGRRKQGCQLVQSFAGKNLLESLKANRLDGGASVAGSPERSGLVDRPRSPLDDYSRWQWVEGR